MLVTSHPVPGTGREPVLAAILLQSPSPGDCEMPPPRLFRLRAESWGIRNPNVTRRSHGASPSVWGSVNRSTTIYTTGPLGVRLRLTKDSASTDMDLIPDLSFGAVGGTYGVA